MKTVNLMTLAQHLYCGVCNFIKEPPLLSIRPPHFEVSYLPVELRNLRVESYRRKRQSFLDTLAWDKRFRYVELMLSEASDFNSEAQQWLMDLALNSHKEYYAIREAYSNLVVYGAKHAEWFKKYKSFKSFLPVTKDEELNGFRITYLAMVT